MSEPNWGTVRLGLAFPEGVVTPDGLQPYLRGAERYEDTLRLRKSATGLLFGGNPMKKALRGAQEARASLINSWGSVVPFEIAAWNGKPS